MLYEMLAGGRVKRSPEYKVCSVAVTETTGVK